MEVITKICSKCKIEKYLGCFHKDKNKKDGVACWCKDCANKYHKDNPEKHRGRSSKWAKDNRGYYSQWRKDNCEKHRAYSSQWAKDNCEKHNNVNSKRRALKRNATVENVDLLQLYENHKWVCGICGLKIDKKLKWPDSMSISHDHIIPLSKGGSHTYNNIKPAHLVCNQRKHDNIDNIQLVLQAV